MLSFCYVFTQAVHIHCIFVLSFSSTKIPTIKRKSSLDPVNHSTKQVVEIFKETVTKKYYKLKLVQLNSYVLGTLHSTLFMLKIPKVLMNSTNKFNPTSFSTILRYFSHFKCLTKNKQTVMCLYDDRLLNNQWNLFLEYKHFFFISLNWINLCKLVGYVHAIQVNINLYLTSRLHIFLAGWSWDEKSGMFKKIITR